MNKCFLAACLLFFLAGSALAESQEPASVLVQVQPLRQMALASRVSGYGTVMSEPGATVNLNFPKAGRIDRLLVSPGQPVKKGQSLLEITTDPAGTLAYGQAENAVAFARGELDRAKALFAQQLATHSQLDNAAKSLKDTEQALAAQGALGGGAKRDKLAAPFDGLVTSISAAQGDRFQAGANLVQLARTDYLRARLGVEPEDSRQLHVGMKVRLASVFDPQRTVEGEVRQVAGQIDAQTQLVDVTVRFVGGAFLPGSRVRGEIAAEERKAPAVPRQAVLRDADGAYLFQVVGGKARRIKVETGIEDGGWVEVRGRGLLNAPVVVLGNYELEDGMAVREAKP
ncbi:MAG TPA: efflux RND transporter periplasmic adaptor subunit [Sulfuricella sp.]|nr:efflux RND transporter periplasmic adaptor subunit [Sulfuricella sp.]